MEADGLPVEDRSGDVTKETPSENNTPRSPHDCEVSWWWKSR
jgi:hypothetical protein